MKSKPGWVAAALAGLAIVAWAAAVAGPGSGSATVTPSAPVAAGDEGTWSIEFTAAEPVQDGQLRITIPTGWTAPQSGSPSSAGYVTITTNEPSATPLMAVGGQVVTIAVDTLTVGNTVTLVYGDDSGSASARATAATTPGSHTFLVESDPAGTNPVALVTSPALDVVAAAPSYLEIAPADTTVTAGAFAEYRLIVRDEFGNRAPVASQRTVLLFPAHGQFFNPSNHGTPITQINILSGKTSVRVDYRGTLATSPGAPHSLTVFTASGSPSLGGFDTVNIIPAGLSTSVSTVMASTPKVANGTDQSSVNVTSKDAFGNPREGDAVVLGVTGSAVKVDPGSNTDEDGEATGAVTNTVAEIITVTATVNGQPLLATAPVTFSAGPVSGATSLVSATTPVVANGIAASTVTVTARDANGNPVSGQSVVLAVTPPGGGAVITQPGGVTNSLGVITGSLASTTTGPRTVTATIGATPVTDDAVVSFTAGPVASFSWTVDGAAVAGVSDQVTLTALDAQGHVITGYTGLVNLTTNSTGVGNGVVEWSDTDALGTITNLSNDDATYQFAAGDNGVAQLRITDTKAETIILTASGPASGVSSSMVVAPGAADEVQLVAGDGQSATVDAPVATPPKVRVVDAFDNVVPGATVTFTVLAGGGSRDVTAGGGVDATGLTASDGTVDCDVWRMGTDTDLNPNQLRASIASGSTPSVDFTATATAGTGASLVLTPGSKNVTVGSTEVVTAMLTDSFGNLTSGEQVTVAVKSGTGTLAEDPGDPGTTTQVTQRVRQGTTDAAGKITVLYQAPASAGLSDVLDASTSNVAQGSVADVTYTTVASGATNLRITWVGSSTQPAGTAAQFTIEAVDGSGNRDTGNTSTIDFTPEGGSGLEFSLSNFGGTITQAALVAGVRTIYVRGTVEGNWDITASTGGLGSDIDELHVTDTGVIAVYSVSTVPGVVAGVSFNVSVSARDQYDNLVDGAGNNITLQAIDDVTTALAQSTLLVTSASLSGGTATVGEQYTKAEAIRVRVFDGSSNEGTSGVLTVSAAAAKRVAKISGDGTGIAAGTNRTLTARVLDAYDNPVASQTVTFLVLQGGGSVLPVSVASGANGDAATTLTTGVVAADNRVRASILDGSPAIDEQVEFSVGTTAGAIAYFTVVPQTTSLVAGQSVPLTITAYDAGNNVVTSDDVTQVQLGSSGSAQFGSATGTLTDGVFATTVRNDVVQSFTVTAELLGGGPPSGTSALISVTNAVTYAVFKVSGDASGIGVGASHPLQVIVRDFYNNPVPGALVTFSVASAPDGTAFFTDADGDPNDGIAVANGSGVATVTYHTAQTAGANTVNAQILDGSPVPREKVLFTVNTVSSSATKLRITFLGPATAAAGASFSFKVDALDASDNLDTSNTSTVTIAPEAGSGLLFSATDFGSTTTTFTLAGGTETIYGRGTTAGNWDITASAGGLTGDTDAVTITHTGIVTSYSVTAAASATAGSPFTVGIEARDTYNNKVTTATNTVTIEAVDDLGPGLTGIPFSVTQATLVAGAVTVNQSYTTADLIRVHVFDGSGQGYSGPVLITPAGAYRVTNVGGDGTGIIAGGPRTLTARVFDPYDNPVQGQLVTFSAVSGGGSTSPPSGSTDIAGNVSTTLTTGPIVGTNLARATILNGNPSALETTDFTVGTVAGPVANYEVTTAKTSLVANEQTNVTIKARDANGNYRTLDNSTSITISRTGSATLGATSGTLAGGQFVTTVLDTVAESFTVSAQTQAGAENGTSPTVTVSNGPAYRVVYVSGSGSSVPAGIDQFLRTEVRDQWNNTVANQAVRYQITASPPGAYLRDAVGDSTDGITASVANGKALARMHTSSTVGNSTITATILDGSPVGRERVTFNITTVSGGITSYVVEMNATSTTAGVSKNATITAYDTNDNVVDDDVQQVALAGDPGTGLVFGTNPVTLTNGVATTGVNATLVQTYNVRASSVGNPSVTGVGPAVSVLPAVPAGAITATATQNTITANGTSTTTITSGVIDDAFGNQVAQGLTVNVSANLGGTIVGGGAKLIGADGRIVFDMQSSNTAGLCTVTMTSATGTASGTIPITFAPKPALACNTPPSPATVVPGSAYAFSVQATNTSPTTVNLTTATTFGFTDGSHTYSANLAAPQSIPGSGNATLVFSSATVHVAFTTTSYAPVVTMIGNDAFLSPVNVAATLPAASLRVTSIEITGIVPASGVVSRGQSSSIAVTIKNNGSQSTTIDDIALAFVPSALITVDPAPELGSAVGPGLSGVFNVPITVQAGAAQGSYQVDAAASGTVGGETVTDNSVAPFALANLQITTAANLSYEPGSMVPAIVTRGDPYSFQVTITNGGGGLVVLDSALTRLTFTDGTRTYSVAPVQPYAIAGGGAMQSMTFRSRTVPANFTPGSYAVSLNADGTENGSPFTQSVPMTGSPVVVQTPAVVAAAGEVLLPDTVSKTTTATFTVLVTNTGGATVDLTPAATTIRFASNQYTAALNSTGPVTLPPGTTALQFLGATVSGAITPGSYFPTVQLAGFENGIAFNQSIVLTDDVVVENAPSIAILDMLPSQTQFTQDQAKPIKVRMVVSNSNGASATFTAASLRFIHAGQDRTSQFVVSTPSTFSGGSLLTSGEIDTVVFNVSDNAGTMSVGNMTIEGELEVEDVNTSQPVFADTDVGGKGNLQVMSPAAIVIDAPVPALTVVTQNMTRVFKVRAVVRNTGGSDAVLTLANPSTRIVFSTPGWIVTSPATLAGGGSTLSGGEVDTLIFNVTTSGSTAGPATVSAATAGSETNSGRPVSGSSVPANLLVQTPGSIQVVGVVTSQPSITSGTTLPWTITVTLSNPGQSDVNLALGANVALSIQNQTIAPAFTVPGALAGGGTLLSGGETDQLVIPLTTSGTYASLGTKAITVDVDGTEVNSGAARNGNHSSGTVLVQQAPDAAFVSLAPGTVSKLTNVAFEVDVTNVAASNRAGMTLDRSLSRLRFGAGQFNVGLAPASPVDIAQGTTERLRFTGAIVGAGIPTGVQADAQLELHWIHNGVAGTDTIALPTQITVQSAPALSILSVRPSRGTLTRQQFNAGTVTMVLRNTGGAAVNLDLSTAVTHLGFKVLGSGATVTPEYVIQAPASLEFAGGTVLSGGATDSLVFDLTQAGITLGSIIVNGYVGGIDLNSSLQVSDDTFDGGSGAIELQSEGALSILSITPAQSTATAGQSTKSYAVKMAVRNTGGASIDISLLKANSDIAFPGKPGFLSTAATMPTGVTLTGGETDTLRFTVTTTGGPAGVATITGVVSGIESNTSLLRGDDTTSGGTGSITLQTPAQLVVDSVTPSRTSITAGTTQPWTTTIALHNAGESNARLTLPAGFTMTVQHATGGTTIVPPTDMEEGGVVLPGGASGTLVAATTATGTFSNFGSKVLNVSVGATELNSNRAFSGAGNGSILVQSAPNLVVTAVRPALVTSGSVIDFEVDVQNPGASSATARLNRGATRVHFNSSGYSAFLDVASPDSIVGGATVTLRFESKLVAASIPAGPYAFNVNLDYSANGNALTEPEVVANGVTVQAPPQLAIQQILVSQPTVTAGQLRDWTATMTVVNNGAANIDLDLSPANTRLTFIGPGGQPDLTYTVNAPVMASGDDILGPSESGQIAFTVATTGTQTGNVVISGRVEGRDVNLVLVTDDTFDGGRGGVLVQTPASVVVTAVHPAHPEVTVGQGGWGVNVVLANTGGADVAINLSGTDLHFTPAPAWAAGSTQPLFGGGNILEGGAVDSLLIPIFEAGDTPGLARIDVDVPWLELNALTVGAYDTRISGTGFGQVLVEDPADIRVFSTTSLAPNPAEVNVGQAFNIQVMVQNLGGADARSVVVGMTTNSASTILPVAPLDVVPAGQSVPYLIPVQAAAVPDASETFTTSIVSAIDDNSGVDSLVTISTGVDRSATVAVQTQAVLDITNVRPSQPTVTRGQANPWNVIVRLRNTGQADAVLAAPAAGDLDFSLAGATKIDYVVQAPSQFGSGVAGWTLAGGATDSLIYNIVATGNDPGTVDIAAAAAGTDRNDPPRALNDTGATTVNVQDVAGLFIATTVPVGTFNHASAARDTVNTGFAYQIHVTVQNSGGEDVDSVDVQLARDGASTVHDSQKRESIAAGASRDFIFPVTAGGAPDALETFTATIRSGVKSHNSGQTVIPQAPLDNLHQVVIQTRADLDIDLFVASPPGSAGGVVGTSQLFTLGARVSNLGQAGVTGPAQVTLTVPSGFTVQEALVRDFVPGNPVQWSVTAPAATQSAQNFTCAITTTPGDINTAAVAFVSDGSDDQSITVSSGGALASPSITLTAPAGAIDDTLSVGQQFTVLTSVAVSRVKDLVGTLTVPAGFSVVGSNVFNFTNGAGTRTRNFNVIAPANADPLSDLFVTFAAVDTITGSPVPSAADTVRVTVVPRTSLSVAGAVTAPPDAMDNTVAIGTPFTITATVTNAAGAAGIAAPGSLQMALPAGYSFASGHTAQKPFVVGMPVAWVVNAAAQPSGPDQFAVTIVNVPADENSGQPAQVAAGTANIAMVTEGAAVSVADVSESMDVGEGVAPGGATGLDVLAFEIAYNVTDTNVSPAEVDTIALTIIDKDGNPLGPTVVGQTLARLAVDLGGAQPYEVVSPNTNPVIVSLVGGGADRVIAPDASIHAVVYLDLDASPRATEIRVRVRGGGMVVRDPGSGQALGVTDTSGQPLDGQITSGPLVVLSSNFEEYAHNYPNPFRAGSSETKIAYFLDAPANVTVKIYDIAGDLVYEESIPSGDPRAQSGPQETTWNGRNGQGETVRNGVYVCVLNAGSHSAKFRIAVAK